MPIVSLFFPLDAESGSFEVETISQPHFLVPPLRFGRPWAGAVPLISPATMRDVALNRINRIPCVRLAATVLSA